MKLALVNGKEGVNMRISAHEALIDVCVALYSYRNKQDEPFYPSRKMEDEMTRAVVEECFGKPGTVLMS